MTTPASSIFLHLSPTAIPTASFTDISSAIEHLHHVAEGSVVRADGALLAKMPKPWGRHVQDLKEVA